MDAGTDPGIVFVHKTNAHILTYTTKNKRFPLSPFTKYPIFGIVARSEIQGSVLWALEYELHD
jgi:hypothetical protein